MKILRKITICVLFFSLFLSTGFWTALSARAARNYDVEADAAIAVDINSGQILYVKNPSLRVDPKGLTRVMTALTAMDAVSRGEAALDQVFTVPLEAFLDYPEGAIGELGELGETAETVETVETDLPLPELEMGEELSLRELLYICIMGESAEAANTIAIGISGSISRFVSQMNALASELGCTDTQFSSTHGIFEDENWTTAEDMFLIAQKAFADETLDRICAAGKHKIPATNLRGARQIESGNRLMDTESVYYNETVSCCWSGRGTDEGMNCIAEAEQGDLHLVCAVLGSWYVESEAHGTLRGHLVSANEIINDSFESYSYLEILSSSTMVSKVPVEMGDSADYVTVMPAGSITVLMENDIPLTDFDYDVRIFSEEAGTTLMAPVNAGDELGEITVSRKGAIYGTVPLIASTSVSMKHMEYLRLRFKELLEQKWVRRIFRVIIIILVLYFAYLITYYVLHIVRGQKRRTQARERLSRLRARDAEIQRRKDGSGKQQ